MSTNETETMRAAVAVATSIAPASGKVLISSLHTALLVRFPGRLGGLTLGTLKALLLAGHRAGQLELSRCDLTGAFDAELVASSETRHLESTYHFVRA